MNGNTRKLRIVALLGLLAAVFFSTSNAHADDARVQAASTALQSYLSDLTSVGSLPALDKALPMTTLHPSGPNGLDLSNVFSDIASGIGSYGSVDDLRNGLEGLDDSSGPIHVAVGNGGSSGPVATNLSGDVLTVTVPLRLSRDVAAPLSFAASPLSVHNGTVSAHLQLDTTLVFTVDLNQVQANAADAVSLAPTTMTFTGAATSAPVSVSTSIGLATVTVGGTVNNASLSLPIALSDPDGTGGITLDEIASTLGVDLASTTPTAALTASITLDTDLIPGAPDATIPFGLGPDGFSATASSPPALASFNPFTKVSADTLLGGVGQLASGLSSLTAGANVSLPLLHEGLASIAKLAQPVLDFVADQSILCGTQDSNPPAGGAEGAAAGLAIFCTASALGAVKPGSITWTPVSGVSTPASNTTGSAADGTIAGPEVLAADKKRVQFTRTTGPVVVQAVYTSLADNVVHHVVQAPQTAVELMQRLASAAGFEATPGGSNPIAYDPATRALTFHLVRQFNVSLPGTPNTTIDIGDKLRDVTHISALSAATPAGATGATVKLGMTGITLDITFGVLLVDNVTDIDPAGTSYGQYDGPLPRGQQDRFFVAAPTGHVLSIDDVTAEVDVNLRGTLGFLGISVDGDGDHQHALTFGKANPANPILSADFHPGSGIPLSGGQTVANAVTLRGLGKLNILTDGTVTKTLNAKAHGALHGKASILTGAGETVLGEGDITVDIPDAAAFLADPTPPNITVDAAGFVSALADFDSIDPTNPQVMLGLILGALTSVLEKIDTGTGAFDTTLPILGKSPKELFTQISALKQSVSELNGGPGPVIQCGNGVDGAGKVTGSPDGLVQADGTQAALRCQAEITKPLADGATPSWVVETLNPPTSTTVAGAANQVGTSSTPATGAVTLTPPSSANGFLLSNDHPEGYRVRLTYTDTELTHHVELPSLGAPTNLQDLADSITEKLGLPAGFLEIGKGTVHKGGTDVTALTLKIHAGICTNDRSDCHDYDQTVNAPTLPLNLQLGAIGGVLGTNAQGSLALSYLAEANLGIAIPLSANPTPLILGDSGLSLAASAGSDALGFSASVASLTVNAGTTADTDDATDGVQAGIGKGHVGAALDVGRTSGNTATDAYEPASFFGPGFAVTPGSSASQDCGTAVNGTTDVSLTGIACAKFSLNFDNTYLGDVGFAASSLTGPFVTAVPDSLIAKLQSKVLSFEFLLKTLDQLVGQLRDSLSGAANGVKLPVVGDVLDAGANVADKLQSVVSALQSLAATVPTDNTAALRTQLHDAIYAQVHDNLHLLQDTNGDGTVDGSDVIVSLRCGNHECGDPGDTAITISKASFKAKIGQGRLGTLGDCEADCATDGVIPFDVGLKGLPVRATGAIALSAGWELMLDFGIDRVKGPFLGVGTGGVSAAVGASLGLGNAPCDNNLDPVAAGSPGVDSELNLVSTTRCLQGTLGFLGVQLRDRELPSSVSVKATLTTSKKGAGSAHNELSLADLIAGLGEAHFNATAAADIHLRLRTGIRTGESISLPSVLGILNITGSIGYNSDSGPSTNPPTITFDHLYLDLGKTFSSFLGGIVGDIKRVTSPFRPIVDTLQAPLPVLSQLAALVGKPPVTLISLLEAVSGADLSLIRSFLSVIQFINALPDPSNDSVLIGLGSGSGGTRPSGSFSVNGAAAQQDQTPDSAGDKLVPNTAGLGGASSDLFGALGAMHSGSDPLNPSHSTYVSDDHDDDPGIKTTFGVRGLEFPLFQNPSNIAKVLMGQDVKIVEYRMGTLRATAGFDVTFGPFFIGPVPVSVFIGGSATITGTFAFGYDTSGIRKVLDGGSGEHLLDGLFLDDLDTAGNDIPELTLTGEVHAGAQVDLVVVKAGVEGGIRLTLNLNLHDDNKDGVLHIEEIASKLSNPICLFDISGQLDFFLNFFLEFDFFFFSDRFTFEILSIKLLDFSASCSPSQPPKLATQSGGTLTLLIGSQANRNARGLAVDQINEKFVVRPIAADGTYSVTAFGLTQEFGPTAKGPGHNANGITTVVAFAGDGKDQVSLVDGATPTDPPVTLRPNAAAEFHGGTDDDVLKGGAADDTIRGDEGNDTLGGEAGNDHLYGDAGNDALNGDLGDDYLYAGSDNDHANGGPGSDHVYGDEGNDVLDGGPANKAVPSPTPEQLAGQDGTNVLVGGNGNDAITGGPGVDDIYGDTEVEACNTSSAVENPPTHQDTVDAGEGADNIWGGPGEDQLTGGPDTDTICGSGGADLIEGDSPTSTLRPGDDIIDGGPQNDFILGRGGDDKAFGGSGNDRILGDTGDDSLHGGTGRDVVDGSAGNDIELGDGGTIDAGAHTGSQAVRVGLAHPVDVAASDTGTCTGGLDSVGRLTDTTSGNGDCLLGGPNADVIFGTSGGDIVNGDDGDDYLDGGSGPDSMRGGANDDTMFGRAGLDIMFGDSGKDVMQGNADSDTMRGGIDDDELQGNEDVDTVYGDGGQDDIVGGSAAAGQDDEGDFLFGNANQDVIAGDNALITRTGGNFAEDPTSQARSVTLYDVDTTDTDLYGGDNVQAGEDNDRVYGQSGDDTVSGGSGKDRLFGNQDVDTMHGDDGDDLMLGGSGGNGAQDKGDTMFGDNGVDTIVGDNGTLAWSGALTPDDSQVVGSFGNDTLRGNNGDDVMYGELGDDTMNGDADHDRMLGDLGTVTPAASGPTTDPDGVPRSTTLLVLPQVGGVDRMFGDGSADRMWGGYEADLMEGGPGDDYIEGNDGADTLRGFNSKVDANPPDNSDGVCNPTVDNDDIIGGSSSANPDSTKRDVGETLIQGNCGFDVILGDNGELTRTPSADNLTWVQDVVQKGPARTIVLDDTARPQADLPLVSGGDTIEGNAGNDKAFGEGGNDTIRGNAGDDVLVGNQDSDVINGNDGEDDVIGGSLGGAAAPGLVAKGQLDAGDRLFGDADQDVILGDNAQVIRPFTGLLWDLDPVTAGHQRNVTLWDTESNVSPTFSGNDLALGGTGNDRIFGQGGNDTLKGNANDDFVQGNQGGDLLEGNGGEDDLVGGSRTAGQLDGDDVIHGGGGADVAIGDNGLIDRAPLNTNGPYDYVTYQIGQVSKRSVKLFDIDSTNPDIAGSDTVAGGQGVDVLFGQGENDYVFGGTEDDYLEGNAATDFEFGDLNPEQVGIGSPPQLTNGLPPLPSGLPLENAGDTTPKSAQPELDGPAGTDGQDDIIGGNSTANRTDANDFQYGNGAADFILGDNGQLTRTISSGAYTLYTTYNPTTIQRAVVRFCNSGGTTCESSGRSGGDYQEGNAGDDYIWGQDGNDTQFGGTENDDMYGELGNDSMFGEDGEDAMVGDRGGITDSKLTNTNPLVNDTTQGPTFFDYHALEKDQLDRRVAMNKDFGGGTLLHPGMTEGGIDYMSGGRGHDSMHGEFNDDVMNGDSGGDYVFGDDGGDALWGGKGSDNPATPNALQENTGPNAAQGITRNNLIDMVFGGYGGSAASPGGEITGGSDIIDWRPRPGVDPASWLAITHTDNDTNDPASTLDNQHHQGLDWIYGGWDRDVMQGDVGKNGPDFGDRLLDWVGAFNLYSRCNASYGDDGDVRQLSPDAQLFIQNLAYGSGVGTSLSDVQTPTSSAGREMALVYQNDIKANNGKAYPTTPGHFDNPFCNGA
ncbi:MAG: hypothetical protein ABR549_14590 [Mycobacteriales bacterium]